jgi:hypothetical protein
MGPKIAADTPKENNPQLVQEIVSVGAIVRRSIPSNPCRERPSRCCLISVRADERRQTI